MPGRARNAPEVVQTSWLDCGPAALTSLLRGFGAPAPYDKLRSLCNTGVDGTSIDSIEAVAVAAGLDAIQMVVPVEQILAMPEEYLPGIIVTMLPDGFTHFVVLWRSGRRRVALMDPASGRMSQSRPRFASELYTHELDVPATAWREWAAGPEFREGLLRRSTALGVGREVADELLNLALRNEGPHGLAAFDAALRAEEKKIVTRPTRPLSVSETLRGHIVTLGKELDSTLWSCVIPAAPSEQVTLRGAVLLRARSWSPETAVASVRQQLEEPEPNPLQTVRDALTRIRWLPLALVLAACLTAVAQVIELLFFRAMLGPDPAKFSVVIAIVLASTVALGVATAGSLRLGRHLDSYVRHAWLRATRELPASFIRSRPVSDIVFRAHSTHRLRDFPPRAIRFVGAALLAVVATIAMIVATPRAAVPAMVLFVIAVALPWAFARPLAHADMRAQTLSGCLARPVTDALLGAQSLKQKGAAPALLIEHDVLATGWERAVQRLNSLTGLSRALTGVVAVGALAWCLYATTGGSIENTLLTLVLGIVIVDAGSTCAHILQTLPAVRSTLLRQSGPLNATRKQANRVGIVRGARSAVALRDATVRSGSVALLSDVDLVIPKLSHVALVGSSGSGKSTLLSVILGTTELSDGEIDRAIGIDRGGVAWAAPTTWLWDGGVRENVESSDFPSAATAESRLALTGIGDPGVFADRAVGEGGALLSDGEAQRVRLARALGRPDAPLVVLDEAMRGLPREQRTSVLSAVRRVWSKSTLVCALHEITDAVTFDLVVVLDAGRVVEVGQPGDLLDDPGSRFSSMLQASIAPLDGWERVGLGERIRMDELTHRSPGAS